MNDNTTALETDAMSLLLDGHDPVLDILRQQYDNAAIERREFTGVGSYTYFTIDASALSIPGRPSFTFGDVWAEISGLDIGAGFLLYIQDGRLHMLETFSYDGALPNEIASYRVFYATHSERDLGRLRETRGWPGDVSDGE